MDDFGWGGGLRTKAGRGKVFILMYKVISEVNLA